MGLMVILYAMKHLDRVNRVVQVGPMEPSHGKPYPAHLTANDDTLREVFARRSVRRERNVSRRRVA
jgi:hypothetical protein